MFVDCDFFAIFARLTRVCVCNKRAMLLIATKIVQKHINNNKYLNFLTNAE